MSRQKGLFKPALIKLALIVLLAAVLGGGGLGSAEGQETEPPRTADVPEVQLPEPPSVSLAPAAFVAQLNNLGIRRLIGEAATRFDPAVEGRAANIRLAAGSFKDLLVAPGQTVSFLDLLGPITAERGYREAYTIQGGEFVPGIGGGVCQVSSTLYLAWLRAGLEAVERHNHSLPVGYVPAGLDATVAEGYLGLRLRNPGPGYVWVRNSVEGDRLLFKIYGDSPSGRTVKVYSKVKLYGAAGVRSVTYREIWEAGKLIRQEKLSSDYYAPAPRVVLAGTGRNTGQNTGRQD